MNGGKIVGEVVEPVTGFVREDVFQEVVNGVGELVESWVIMIGCDLFVHNFPASFDDVQIGTVGRQKVQTQAR